MNCKLSEMVEMHSGVVLNRKEAVTDDSSIFLYNRVTLRSLSEEGTLIKGDFEPFRSKERIESASLTQKDDVLVRLSMPMNPIVVPEELTGLVIPSQIAAVRLKNGAQMYPAYVRWYLAQKSIADALQAAEHGTSQRTIKVKSVMDLNIEVPPLSVQWQIAQIDMIGRQRARLYLELIAQEKLQTEMAINVIMGGYTQ